MEKQRLAEWEKQRKEELIQHRQREQEKVLFFKAKMENLQNELDAKVIYTFKGIRNIAYHAI